MKDILKNIYRILEKQERSTLIRLLIFDVVMSILDIAFLVGLLLVISFYTNAGVGQQLRSLPIFSEYPLLLMILFFVLFSLKNFFGFLVFRYQYKFVYQVASRISKNKLLQFLHSPFNEYVETDSAINLRKISQQPIEFSHYVLHGMQIIIGQSVLVILTVTAILVYNPVLFFLLVLILLPAVLAAAYFMKRKLTSIRLFAKTSSERSIQYLQEALSGFVESNIYHRQDFFTNRYSRFQSQLNSYLSQNQVIQNMPSRFIEAFAVFGLLILLVLHVYGTGSASIQLVTIAAFMTAAYKVIPGIVKIMNHLSQVKTYKFSLDGLGSGGTSQLAANNNMEIISVQFDGVHFSYGNKKILSGLNFSLSKGDMLGISGASGHGKTTILNLLLGFMQVETGNILINGEKYNTEQLKACWSRISYSKQQSFLLHDTIDTNITLQETGNDHDKLKLVKSICGISEMEKQKTAEFVVAENGRNLSGGQRQRIIFARALYKDADLLIMDEPFNELDEHAESGLLTELQNLATKGKIIILVTHNAHALTYCNKKISLDE